MWAVTDDIGEKMTSWLMAGWLWLQETFLEPERLIELAVIIAAFWLGRLSSKYTLKLFELVSEHSTLGEKINMNKATPVLVALFTLLFLWTGRFALVPVLEGLYLLPLATSLVAAWVIVRLLVSFIAKPELARLVAVGVWGLAALNILGILPTVMAVLDGAILPVGDAEISALDVITAVVSFGLFIWGALFLSSLLENRMHSLTQMPASARVLIAKSGRIILLGVAFLLALNAAGIDLTALAVFGGALGVGIGFGLQKVVGNFISGLILLLDRSIKPGDVIETGGTYGRINKLAARYTSVITRDGTEFLIPNEDMITQTVVNWSHSDLLVRRRIPVQVSYDSDLRRAMDLTVEAALAEDRVLKYPKPRCLLRGFGENGVDLELRLWIKDPENGVSNIGSEVMLHIWDKFQAHGIEFPFPQRVVHLANADAVKVPPLAE